MSDAHEIAAKAVREQVWTGSSPRDWTNIMLAALRAVETLIGRCLEAAGALQAERIDHICALDRIEALEAENAALREALLEAAEDIVHWGGYADDYFKEKWGLADDVAKARAAAGGVPESPSTP